MEQGIINNDNGANGNVDVDISSIITNSNVISSNTGYVLTRNNNQEITVLEEQERIINLNNVNAVNEFTLSRNGNSDLNVVQAQERIININTIQNGQTYNLTRDPVNNLIVQQTQNVDNNNINLGNIDENNRFVLSRNANNEIIAILEEERFGNLNFITTGVEFVITRDNNNELIVIFAQERINDLNTVNNNNGYVLTRNNNNELTVELAQERITNIGDIVENQNFQLTRNSNGDLIANNTPKEIEGLNDILANRRYHLTRNNNEVNPIEDESVQISTPTTGDLIYGIRRENQNFTLTRVPNFIEYPFRSNNLQTNANFNIAGASGSRCAYVINASGKISKVGIIHVSTFRTVGLIDRDYSFEFIINNINLPQFTITFPGGETLRSLTQDVENLDVFVNQGDCLGIRYVPTTNVATGNYFEIKISVDTNNRQTDFESELIP